MVQWLKSIIGLALLGTLPLRHRPDTQSVKDASLELALGSKLMTSRGLLKIYPCFLFAGIALLLFTSCNDSFSPKGPFEQQLVVYSVLSTDRDIQFVRVYTNYNASGFDPFQNNSDTPVKGARVVITGPRGSYTLKDTLLARPDTSRYKSPIAAYTGRWRAEPGQAYTLTVNAPGIGTTSASVVTPGLSQTKYWFSIDILDDPDNYKGTSWVGAYTMLMQSTKAYSCQLAIEYLVLTSGEWKPESIEVPVWASSSFAYVGYPSVYKVQSYAPYAGVVYSKDIYMKTLQRVIKLHAGSKLIFQRIAFRFLLLDQNWYDYYNTVRSLQDPFSIRLDEPDFTNLSNGYGLFGASAIDSVQHFYPDEFPYNR